MSIPFRDMIAMLHFARTMSAFGPDFEDPLTQKAWHNKLKDIPSDHLKKALNQLSGDRNFPAPNQIVDFCKGVAQVADLLPEAAFELLWRKIGTVGGYNDPELPNEIGLAVERLGGWRFICNEWTDDKRTWHEKAFREIYLNLQESKTQCTLPTSKYAPSALRGDVPKQIDGAVKEVLRMAMGDSERQDLDFTKAFREMKDAQK